MTTNTNAQKSFFDLHITGLGYLNRIREVPIRKGEPFLACDIVALHGDATAPEKTRFDCKVAGGEADKLIRRCMPAVAAEKKVLIGFRLGDLTPDIFTYKGGEKKDQPGVSLKARLLFVSWIKVDGEMVYKAEPKGDAEQSQQAQQAAAEPQQPEPSSQQEAPAAASF
ncbi:STY4534 family ICE replication protein [Pseudomonas sp. GOM7]|uniref:STY4534 family ICE replication protein n=1 Tax=Pseudomonas sp. GOM7 TaxID=2998079 RepID=UPI00227D35D7|nr:STY4534 family ICE replication protein [Pseudomonas sp. GOM7]WAJ37244.1 STY4534 family ICE replication protein [Pseudomonas sp. GOM7]